MNKWWKEDLNRRTLLRLGVTGATLAAMPWAFTKEARATETNPHLLVVFYADGGWDPTQTLDAHDPLDMTDGIDVDNPGQPVSAIRTVGPITYQSNPATRPMVDTFFDNFAGKSAIVNAISTRSTSHDQSRQLMLTGYLDPTRADFAVMAAHHNGESLPLPHLLLSGPSFGGPFAGLSGRAGGQMGTALDYLRIPTRTDPNQSNLAASAVGEAYIQQALDWDRQRESSLVDAVGGKLAGFYDAQRRGDKLGRLRSALQQQNMNNGTQFATFVGNAFRAGLMTSVTVGRGGGFDTHSDNTQQNGRWSDVFQFLNDFCTGLQSQAGLVSGSLLDETTIVQCSEFGRTPKLNDQVGKDHHPWTSMIMVGKNVKPGVYGFTDGDQEGIKVNFATGQPDDTGQIIDVTNVVAGIVTLVGANSRDYLPSGVKPLTAMIA